MSNAVRVYHGKFGRVALLDMDRPLVPHAHSQCHVLIKISGADTFFCVGDKFYPLTDDTAVLVNSWTLHSYAHHNPEAPDTLILALYIEPAWLAEIERAMISSAYPGFFPQPGVQISKPIRHLSNAIASHMLHAESISEHQFESMLSNLMIAVIDAFSEWRNFNSMQRNNMGKTYDTRIRRVLSYMRANVGAELDVDHLASQACLSRAHFFKLFQQATSLTPHTYANVLRINSAIKGVTQTQQALIGLSEQLGFSAQSHFTRFFQQHLGASPSQYRKVADVYRSSDDASHANHADAGRF